MTSPSLSRAVCALGLSLGAMLPSVAAAQAAAARPATNWQAVLLGPGAIASGDFICDANVTGNQWAGRCSHRSLAPLQVTEEKVGSSPNFDAEVCGALERQHVQVPFGAVEIDASGVLHAGQSVPDSATVYFQIYFPFKTAASLAVPDVDPGGKTPWLHHAGSCMAHLMWIEQRTLHP